MLKDIWYRAYKEKTGVCQTVMVCFKLETHKAKEKPG